MRDQDTRPRLEHLEIAPPPDAPDFGLKLERAREHLQGLDKEIDRFIQAIDETVTEEPDPAVPGHHGAWVVGDDPARYPISVITGDCLQCLRTSLDQLAFQLAASFTSPLPDDVAQDSEFPILPDVDRHGKGGQGPHLWRSSGVRKTRGLDPAAQQIIESKQPYHAGPAYSAEPLWELHDLNRVDKHRLLHTSVASNAGAIWAVGKARNVATLPAGQIAAMAGRVEGRTQVARWPTPTPIDPSQEVHAGFRPNLDVTFADSVPLVARQSVLGVLIDLYNHIASDVFPPLVGFLK